MKEPRRNKDYLVALHYGIADFVADIVQALLHMRMRVIGTGRHKIYTYTHVPFTGMAVGILVQLTEGLLADTIDKDNLDIQLGR